MTTKKKVNKYRGKEEIYFQCKHKDCNKIVFTPTGALTHANRGHGLKIGIDKLLKHFSEIENPPQKIVDEVEQKRKHQRDYRDRKRQEKMKNVNTGPNFECNECGWVVGNKSSLYGHTQKKHNKPLSEVGYRETNKPPTNPYLKMKRPQNPKEEEVKLPSMMQHMPELLDITDSEAIEDGVILTVRFKIPTPYVAAFILPTLT